MVNGGWGNYLTNVVSGMLYHGQETETNDVALAYTCISKHNVKYIIMCSIPILVSR